MNPLKTEIINLCQKQPLRLDHYMKLCLTETDNSYYQSAHIVGRAGDFITAPEISQLFGEIIAAWLIDFWQTEHQSDFIFVEAGAGRASLMQDILTHAEKICPEFAKKAEIHIIEINPDLQKQQCERLKNYQIHHHDTIETVPEKPMIFLANEFLDVFPIRQFFRKDNDWFETYITYHQEKDRLDFLPIKYNQILPLPELHPYDGAWLEFSDDAIQFSKKLGQHLQNHKGVALFIDYGGLTPLYDSPSFQALKKHTYVDSLDDSGEADLTAHVNFPIIAHIFENYDLKVEITTQKNFLTNFGIIERANFLIQKNPDHKNEISQALKRLIDPEQMGELFKFMSVKNIDGYSSKITDS